MYKQNITMEVLTSNGNPVTEYHKNGENFIEGRKGSKFSVKIRNNNAYRVSVILSIDGLSVVDGEEASYKSEGYILNPYETYIIDGWRTNLETVREFFFTKKNNSYSKKSGQGTSNLGIIGLAVFTEKHPLNFSYTFDPLIGGNWDKIPSNYRGAGDMFFGAMSVSNSMGSASASIGSSVVQKGAVPQNVESAPVGTGMGQNKESVVQQVNFNSVENPFVVMQVYYKERKELERLGIIKNPVKKTRKPEAFPGQFCREI